MGVIGSGFVFFFQAEDGIRDGHVTGVQTCALPISGWPGAKPRWCAGGGPGCAGTGPDRPRGGAGQPGALPGGLGAALAEPVAAPAESRAGPEPPSAISAAPAEAPGSVGCADCRPVRTNASARRRSRPGGLPLGGRRSGCVSASASFSGTTMLLGMSATAVVPP